MYQATEGIVLSHKNFGEADRLLTIYTKDFGKINCIAKGVKRPKSRKSGHVEIASWCKIFTARGKSLDILTEVELKKSFGHEDFSTTKANKIYHILELVDCLTPHNQKNTQVFDLLLSFLKKIDSGENFNLISSAFKLKLLAALGFFSADNLKYSSAKNLLTKFETDDFDSLKSLKIDDENYLKLLAFLDSIIEDTAERKLKTNKFLNAAI